jgi:hypothetical protein
LRALRRTHSIIDSQGLVECVRQRGSAQRGAFDGDRATKAAG